jgi:hypothetical protein
MSPLILLRNLLFLNSKDWVYSEDWGAFLNAISISFGGRWPIFRVQHETGGQAWGFEGVNPENFGH